MRKVNENTKKAIEALSRLGIAASQAGETLRKFADVYEDLRLYVKRLCFIRLP